MHKSDCPKVLSVFGDAFISPSLTGLKQSGHRQQFEGGAQRDTDKGKPRPDLICPFFRERLGMQLARGAEHYGARNWERGMPQSRVLASLHRHLMQYEQGRVDEDHLAAVAFNVMVLLSQDERSQLGLLDKKWIDHPPKTENK